MLKDLKTAGIVLLVGGAVAIASNAVRTGHKHVKWVGEPRPTDVVKPPEVTTGEEATAGDAPQQEVPRDPSVVALDEVIRHLNDQTAFFVDARKPAAYAEGHIRGAFNIPSSAVYDSIGTAMNFIPPSEPVIVYCGGGDCESSHVVAGVLREFDYENVRIYKEGWAEFEMSEHYANWTATGAEP